MGVELTKKAGVIVSRRHMWWQKMHHDRVKARISMLSKGFLSKGVYLEMRCMAGQTWNAGSMRVGEKEHADVKDLQRWIARTMAGDAFAEKMDEAMEILKDLKSAGLIAWGTDRVVYVMDWADEQAAAPSASAERKRQERERRRSLPHDDAGPCPEGPEGEDGSAAVSEAGFTPAQGSRDDAHGARAHAPPSSPASTPISSASGVDSDPKERERKCDKSHTREDENENEKRGLRLSNSTSTPSGLRPSFAGDEGGADSDDFIRRSDDIYAMDPVDAACALTGETKPFARNGFKRALKRAGVDLFRLALGELRQAQRDGIRPRTSWGGYFHGIVRKNEERRDGEGNRVVSL